MAAIAFPKIPAKSWRVLRSRAATAPSTRFTPSSVAAILGMASPRSARDNIVGPLKRLGLIDDDGVLTDSGNKWRNDSTYPDACQEILDNVYPDELSHFISEDGRPDPQQIRTWFDHQRFGESNAKQMTATYVMIASKEIPAPGTEGPKKAKQTSKVPGPRRKRKAMEDTNGDSSEPDTPIESRTEDRTTSRSGPSVHIDIQIHIPADASAEQIDQIFARMARHLYGQ